MSKRVRTGGEGVAHGFGRVRAAVTGDLRARVALLEEEVQECRQLNLRVAELVDVVQELLLPVAQRDEERSAEVMEKYSKGL